MNQSGLHILFLPAWYPYDDDPMSGLFVQNHARAVAKFQKVTIVHAQPQENITGKFRMEVSEENGFPEILIYFRKIKGNFPLLTPFRKMYRLRRAICKGVEYLEKQYGKPTIIHAHILTRYGVFAYFLSKRWKIPFVVTEHWSRYLPVRNEFKGFWRKMATRKVVKHAAAILPVTQNLAEGMQVHKLKNPNYRVVPNVVDTDLFIPVSEKPPKDIFRFVHISCIDNRAKNVEGLLDTVKLFSEEKGNFHLTIIGDGPDLEQVKNYVVEKEVASFVTFTGILRDRDLVMEIQRNHCLMMFSNFENMPVVINESFACGLPVIATDVGGISEHITSERGILVKPGDKQGLKDAMLTMMENYDKYNFPAIRQYAVENFSYQRVGEQLNQIYLEVLSDV